KARLLSRPSAFSSAKATLPYQTAVEVLGREGSYCKVKTARGQGYVTKLSLADKKPAYSARLKKDYVSSDEVALATKGFNEQVEAQYRREHAQLPYPEVDKLEKETHYADPAAEFKLFRKQGRLGEYQEGGER
ncbi:SH3 domain-containing protein, partial [candidate division FCPU426 bacterium]|nr:SH3 domain-containing protein [candidate division FCPU426 bacterium]